MKKYLLIGVVNGHTVPTRKFSTRQKAEIALGRFEILHGLECRNDEETGLDHMYCYGPRTWFHITRAA